MATRPLAFKGPIMTFLLALLALFQSSQGVPTAKEQQRPPTNLQFSILGVTVGEDNLKTLQKKLGPTTRCRDGEHAYIAGYTNSREDLIFEFGEVGAGDITGFYIRPAQRPMRCSLSPLPSGSGLKTAGGVHLGLARAEFVHIFGLPENQAKRSSWKYKWSWQEKLQDDGPKKANTGTVVVDPASDMVDVTVFAQAKFDGDSLRYFGIWKVRST
jgi:hypothetical protein